MKSENHTEQEGFDQLLSVVFGGGLNGAGDTRYVMWMMVTLSWVLMIVPTYLACMVFGRGLYLAWGFKAAFIVALGLTYLKRFRMGKWRTMRVIERAQNPDQAVESRIQ